MSSPNLTAIDKSGPRRLRQRSPKPRLRREIAYIERDPASVRLMDRMVRRIGPGWSLRSFHDAEQAIDAIVNSPQRLPDLILIGDARPGSGSLRQMVEEIASVHNVPMMVLPAADATMTETYLFILLAFAARRVS